jgi:hypothetical protein
MAPTRSQQDLQSIEALDAVAVEIEREVSAGAVRAGIWLTLLGWDLLAVPDSGWDGVALTILTADERLGPCASDARAVCMSPIPSDPGVPQAVARLVRSLAVRARLVATGGARTGAEGPAWDAAATEVGRSAAVLS